ncbi:MAG TPA: hypothetical protein VM597_13870 [Gemmataceae bacterium]|nr:hypothetical protein [Gemmataceae bacterium]
MDRNQDHFDGEAMMEGTRDDGRECVVNRRRVLKLFGCGGVALALGSTARPAAAATDGTVYTGTQEDALFTDGCTSPVGFCARGTFKGNHGFQGTSAFSAAAFDPIPSDPLGRLAVPGESTYTTRDGRITVSDVSVFDVARGTFAGVGRVVEGTGAFAGATGDVFTSGHVLEDGSSFATIFVIELSVPE